MRLLIIEDENQIAIPLKKALEHKGYAVDVSNNGKDGHELASINEYDCILLDLNLPEMDGIEIAQSLRRKEINTPILMLTARTGKQNIWKGFESGSDDYLTKPFDFKELELRINALIKRNSANKSETLKYKNVEINSKSFEVKVSGTPVDLNNKEFGILEYLLRNINSVVSAEELLEHVWDAEIDMFSQTVRTNIKTLRKKIDPNKDIIKTIRGKGYVIRK